MIFDNLATVFGCSIVTDSTTDFSTVSSSWVTIFDCAIGFNKLETVLGCLIVLVFYSFWYFRNFWSLFFNVIYILLLQQDFTVTWFYNYIYNFTFTTWFTFTIHYVIYNTDVFLNCMKPFFSFLVINTSISLNCGLKLQNDIGWHWFKQV